MSDDSRKITPIGKRIGLRLKARRLAIGMSQERLGELLGITFQQVQKYEKGVNRIAADRLHDAAEALGWPVGLFFVTPDGERAALLAEDAAGGGEALMATPEGARIAKALEGAPAAVRMEAAKTVESLVRVAGPFPKSGKRL